MPSIESLFAPIGYSSMENENYNRSIQNAAKHNKRTICTVNSQGGGGKSSLGIQLALAAQDARVGQVLLSDGNSASSPDQEMLGIPDEGDQHATLNTLVTEEAHRRLKNNPRIGLDVTSYEKLEQYVLRQLPTNLWFLPFGVVNTKEVYETQDVKAVLKQLKQNVQLLVVTTGNNLQSPLNLGAVEASNTVMFTWTRNRVQTMKPMIGSMHMYHDELGYVDQVTKSHICVQATKRRDTPASLYDMMTEDTAHKRLLESYGYTPETLDRIHLIHESSRIANTSRVLPFTANAYEMGQRTWMNVQRTLLNVLEDSENVVKDQPDTADGTMAQTGSLAITAGNEPKE